MGMQVGRIEKEFVFKALVDEGAACDVHATCKEARCRFVAATEDDITLAFEDAGGGSGQAPLFTVGEDVRVFFYLKNNYHTFASTILSVEKDRILVARPKGVYKNLQRKYERVKPRGEIAVSFTLSGRKIELNFPKSERFNPVEPPEPSPDFDTMRIHDLVKAFRQKMESLVSSNTITMLRDRLPRTWEEKVVTRLGKALWIPSTEEDFPARDPFPDGRVITKAELIHLEEESGAQPHVVSGRLGNILYEKAQKKDIYSELYCPILYNEYSVGTIRVWNGFTRREKISKAVLEYVQQFSMILAWSLVHNGYFKSEALGERRYEAPIIDMSASGLLFAHTNADLGRELLIHTDLDLAVRIDGRLIPIGARIMRKFKDPESVYFGALFLRLTPEDFAALFAFLYGKPFDPVYESTWEGGAPPPPVQL